MQDLFTLHDPFVMHTLFAFASLALGMLGMVLGQRVATQGKLCMLLGAGVGAFTVWLLASPYAVLAPGFAGVFVFSFLASGLLMRVASAGNPAAPKKPAAPPAPQNGGKA
jgi:uncharacterized membrane protein YedE/YeeE